MSVSNEAVLRHPPEVVVSFVQRLIQSYSAGAEGESERRAQPRRLISIPIVVQPLDANFQPVGDVFHAMTKDISRGGVGISHNGRVAAKYLQIEVATRDGEKMTLMSKVEHCTPDGQLYHIGARFVVDWTLWR